MTTEAGLTTANAADPSPAERRAPARRHLLALRFALINAVAFALTAAVWLQGWLEAASRGHTGWLVLGIVAVFLYGLVLCAVRVWSTARAIEAARDGARLPAALVDVDGLAPELLRMRLLDRIGVVRHVAESLVFLGLVGTVVGFILALSGVDPEKAASVDSIAPMVATLIDGMSIALYTTLIGAVLHVWLMVGYRILSSGTLELYVALVGAGNGRVGR